MPVRGLDYPFTLATGRRCCPSSLYTFPSPGLARDYHFTGFPEFEHFKLPESFCVGRICPGIAPDQDKMIGVVRAAGIEPAQG